MTTTWWFEVVDEDSDLCGEEFFVEVEGTLDTAKAKAIAIAKDVVPGTKIACHGRISEEDAEMMGYDTY